MKMGVEDKNGASGCLEVPHQFTEEGRFTGSDLSGDNDETLLGLDPIKKGCERLPIDRIGIKKVGVRRDAKGRLLKPEVTIIHGFFVPSAPVVLDGCQNGEPGLLLHVCFIAQGRVEKFDGKGAPDGNGYGEQNDG